MEVHDRYNTSGRVSVSFVISHKGGWAGGIDDRNSLSHIYLSLLVPVLTNRGAQRLSVWHSGKINPLSKLKRQQTFPFQTNHKTNLHYYTLCISQDWILHLRAQELKLSARIGLGLPKKLNTRALSTEWTPGVYNACDGEYKVCTRETILISSQNLDAL